MDFRYYFFVNGKIFYGDDLAAADLGEAIATVKALIALRHPAEMPDAFEIWSGPEMLYRSTERTGTRTVPEPPHVGQTTRLPPTTSRPGM